MEYCANIVLWISIQVQGTDVVWEPSGAQDVVVAVGDEQPPPYSPRAEVRDGIHDVAAA